MTWIKVNIMVSLTPELQLVNLDNFSDIKADPMDSTKTIFTRPDSSTITADAEFDDIVKVMQPVLHSQDVLGNPV